MKKLLNGFGPALFWSAVLVLLLVIPGSDLPSETPFFNIPDFDKIVHIVLFALFVYLWCRGFRKARTNKILKFVLVAAAAILLGYLMELVQKYFIPNRDYDMRDVLADSIGAIAGLLISIRTLR